jgi:FixJ family two-component response regulator
MTAKVTYLPRELPETREQKSAPVRSIAIVDDDEPVRRAFARLLRAYSFQTKIYDSGTEFLRSLNTSVPDCVIVDVHMDDMSGFELLLRLSYMGLRIPAVVVTARDEPGVQADCELCGGAALLIKPVEGQSLLNAIETAIGTAADRDARGQ